MSDDTAKAKYAHLKNIIGGGVKTGNPVKDDLLVSDAERNLAQLVKARPNIVFEAPKEPTKTKRVQ